MYCIRFFPFQAKYIAVDVLSLTKIVTMWYVNWESKFFHTKQFPIRDVSVFVLSSNLEVEELLFCDYF